MNFAWIQQVIANEELTRIIAIKILFTFIQEKNKRTSSTELRR